MIHPNPTQFESVLTIIGFDTVSVSILEAGKHSCAPIGRFIWLEFSCEITLHDNVGTLTGLLLPLVQQPFRYVIMERDSSGKYKSDLLMNQ
ncbi:unnamed protein product [Musa hybrid cultivar]